MLRKSTGASISSTLHGATTRVLPSRPLLLPLLSLIAAMCVCGGSGAAPALFARSGSTTRRQSLQQQQQQQNIRIRVRLGNITETLPAGTELEDDQQVWRTLEWRRLLNLTKGGVRRLQMERMRQSDRPPVKEVLGHPVLATISVVEDNDELLSLSNLRTRSVTVQKGNVYAIEIS